MIDGEADFTTGQLSWSINRLAREFGMARETVTKRLADASVRPCGNKAGHPVYRLADVAPLLVVASPLGEFDPMTLRPTDRRAWYQSENERLKFEQETGNLILAAEVHHEMAAIAKIVVRELETLPDRVERDLRCSPEVVEYLQAEVRGVRSEIARKLAAQEIGAEEHTG